MRNNTSRGKSKGRGNLLSQRLTLAFHPLPHFAVRPRYQRIQTSRNGREITWQYNRIKQCLSSLCDLYAPTPIIAKSSGQEKCVVVDDTSLEAGMICSLYTSVGTLKHFVIARF